MTRFLITGEGFPAFTVLKAAHELPGSAVAAFIPGSSAAVKATAFSREHGIPILPRTTLAGEAPLPKEVNADWLVNINGTTIICAEVIEHFAGRSLNMHPGLLPRYAGLHCHQWAIRNGESVQGMTIHVMDKGVDTGPILAQKTIPILETDTGLSLFKRTMEQGAALLIDVLKRIVSNDVPQGLPQDLQHRRLYRHKDALEGEIDWRWSARKICDFVRAANYDPLVCPTYTPTARICGERVILRGCEISSQPVSAEPGTLLLEDPGRPVIACGDQEAIAITRALRDGKAIESSDWQALTGAHR
jgi:UDP-4-amino-4-deoxy-L-arabinose formyltransferase/UDP-glucuronic acid dehydrogenase (UDP-4-keto-hexauronic acid decarboxylating)